MTVEERFKKALQKQFVYKNYGRSSGKELSCDWILKRVSHGEVIDVGGTEWLIKKLRNKGISCVYYDAFPPSDQTLNENSIIGDMSDVLTNVSGALYDFVVCRHTLEHSLNPLFVLWQFNQMLKEGGRVFVIVPSHFQYWVWFYTHFNCIPKENWLMLFYRAGFKVIESEDGHWDDEQKNKYFVEHRFLLEAETKEIRLDSPEF